jgi:hypothetical protein
VRTSRTIDDGERVTHALGKKLSALVAEAERERRD